MDTKNCVNCGMSFAADTKFCPTCGTAAPVQEAPAAPYSAPQAAPGGYTAQAPYAAPAPQPYAQQQQYYNPPLRPEEAGEPGPDSKYAPVSMWQFVGMQLLMMIPLANIICLIIWACGNCKKVNQINWARGQLVVMAIGMALSLLLGLVAMSLMGSVMSLLEGMF